ncbi:MAG: DUF4290 domain-containing protein [Muribaculaceae bacterium]|nr:DUF4290 domain-containing protein [Muribaculaceae bacterium]
MIPYNTRQTKLALPEYGRLVHEMIDICGGIEDRDSRNAFAAVIVETMKAMTQEKGKFPDDRKYWDHIHAISAGQLDIDYPYGTPQEAAEQEPPKKIPYSASDFGRRHYGHILQKLVREVAMMPNSEDKDACVELLATHIKKSLVVNNSENSTDEIVLSDLAAMSSGKIQVEEGLFDLPEYKEEKPTKTAKKKKNNR